MNKNSVLLLILLLLTGFLIGCNTLDALEPVGQITLEQIATDYLPTKIGDNSSNNFGSISENRSQTLREYVSKEKQYQTDMVIVDFGKAEDLVLIGKGFIEIANHFYEICSLVDTYSEEILMKISNVAGETVMEKIIPYRRDGNGSWSSYINDLYECDSWDQWTDKKFSYGGDLELNFEEPHSSKVYKLKAIFNVKVRFKRTINDTDITEQSRLEVSDVTYSCQYTSELRIGYSQCLYGTEKLKTKKGKAKKIIAKVYDENLDGEYDSVILAPADSLWGATDLLPIGKAIGLYKNSKTQYILSLSENPYLLDVAPFVPIQ